MSAMMNQPAVEALCSATFLENYLNSVENLPNDLQRIVTQMRELDASTNDAIKELKLYEENWQGATETSSKRRALLQMQNALIRCQDMGDEKLKLVSNFIEKVEVHTRQLEQDAENLDPINTFCTGEKPEYSSSNNQSAHSSSKGSKSYNEEKTEKSSSVMKRHRRQRIQPEVQEEEKKEEKDKPKKKKKRKNTLRKETKSADIQDSPLNDPIDPDEETYCSCNQISYGEMICCDNNDCTIQWFHFNCVNLINKPKGKWFCPQCRGDKPTVKRPDIK